MTSVNIKRVHSPNLPIALAEPFLGQTIAPLRLSIVFYSDQLLSLSSCLLFESLLVDHHIVQLAQPTEIVSSQVRK